MRNRDSFLDAILPEMAVRRAIVQDWIDGEPLVDWVAPSGGVVGFPRLNVAEDFDVDRFHKALLEQHGTYVGPGHWFEMPKRFFRVGFGWPTEAELRGGLEAISAALRQQNDIGARSALYGNENGTIRASSRLFRHLDDL